MEIHSQDIEVGGEGREKIIVDYSGESLDIGFNAQYFMDLLKHIDTEQVKILLDTPITAVIVLQSEQLENEDLLMILMPVRLNEYYSESSGGKESYEGNEKNYQKEYSDGADN